MDEMTPEQALAVLTEVGAKFVGNLNDHQAIQRALEVLRGVVAEHAVPQTEPVTTDT